MQLEDKQAWQFGIKIISPIKNTTYESVAPKYDARKNEENLIKVSLLCKKFLSHLQGLSSWN